jgi:two-component system sensor histidine kinase HydH
MTEVERHRLERQANQLELVSRWADDLAHEIKNPLHAMVINLELVKRRAGGDDPAPLIARAEVVETELHRVHGLVDSLLHLVRPWPPTGTAGVEEVFQALRPVVEARTAIRKVEYLHDPAAAIAAVPPGDLALMILNLLDNAIEATPEGGRVTSAVTAVEDLIRVSISDTGRGLPDGPRERLFESGTGQGAGSGLGLAVSRRLAERAGGSIRLEPIDGSGTRAILTLPSTRSDESGSA